jgi:hypothetical protein
MRWELLRNGDLLKAAEEERFHVMVTADQSIFYQQNNRLRQIVLVVVSTNHLPSLERDMEPVRAAVGRALPGTFAYVPIAYSR